MKPTNGRASPCRPPWQAAAPPPCTALAASTAAETTTTITVTLQYQAMYRYTFYFTCGACNGHHVPRRRRAVDVGSGADGVALNHFSTFLFDSTHLLMSATRRVNRYKSRLILSRNDEARRVLRHCCCVLSSCFVLLYSLLH